MCTTPVYWLSSSTSNCEILLSSKTSLASTAIASLVNVLGEADMISDAVNVVKSSVLVNIRLKSPSVMIPIIFLTARTDRIAKNAGGFLAEDYIEKPAKIPELKKRGIIAKQE